ncbi:MAG: hypothetical protein K8L91_21115 [Anaerolineae bacterium]|nr:hypothetical protein [Anaerolineae bacterium]
MIKLPYLESHIGSIEQGITLINRFLWHVSIVEEAGEWRVYGGEKVIFASDSREAIDAFLYGMGLAYSTIPEDFIKRLIERKFPHLKDS